MLQEFVAYKVSSKCYFTIFANTTHTSLSSPDEKIVFTMTDCPLFKSSASNAKDTESLSTKVDNSLEFSWAELPKVIVLPFEETEYTDIAGSAYNFS
jgi:hypothetical protein